MELKVEQTNGIHQRKSQEMNEVEHVCILDLLNL